MRDRRAGGSYDMGGYEEREAEYPLDRRWTHLSQTGNEAEPYRHKARWQIRQDVLCPTYFIVTV